MEVLGNEHKEIHYITSSNISAHGAFFSMVDPIAEGTRVKLTLSIPNEMLKELTGVESIVKIDGTVVRCESTGIAFCFDSAYQIDRI